MVGGAGSDTYQVANAADVITPGSGATTVWSSVSYHLPDDVSGTLTGSANLSLWAGAGADKLQANSGNDVLYAGTGSDTLSSGTGSDTFVFGLSSAHDVVTNLNLGSHDVLDLSSYFHAGYTASLSESGGNAVISVSNGEMITLIGIDEAALTRTSQGYIH
jgi:Ca2+-binding RTX toxin-like protein